MKTLNYRDRIVIIKDRFRNKIEATYNRNLNDMEVGYKFKNEEIEFVYHYSYVVDSLNQGNILELYKDKENIIHATIAQTSAEGFTIYAAIENLNNKLETKKVNKEKGKKIYQKIIRRVNCG